MLMYRPHRGGLRESMAEAREVEGEEEVKKIVGQTWQTENVTIENQGYDDDRIGWKNVKYVMANGYVCGMIGEVEKGR